MCAVRNSSSERLRVRDQTELSIPLPPTETAMEVSGKCLIVEQSARILILMGEKEDN